MTEAAPAADFEQNADGQFLCPECTNTYSRARAVRRHLTEKHGWPVSKSAERRRKRIAREKGQDVSKEDELVEGALPTLVDTELRAILQPLKDQRDTIDRRLVQLQREMTSLRESRRRIDTVIRGLQPTPQKANATVSTAAQDEKKRKAVQDYIKEHKDDLAGGFSAASLTAKMKENGSAIAVSDAKMRVIVEELRDAGVIRADRIGQGGGMLYQLN